MSQLPVVFVSHGAPTLALDPGIVGSTWAEQANSWPKPELIVVISAHWQSARLAITAASVPKQIYDFYGFPSELSAVSYRPSGSLEKAQWLANLLGRQGWPCELNSEQGLDHGVWIPLMYMYPNADIPVLALTLPRSSDPGLHYQLGTALRSLGQHHVLCIGSGGLTHNLSYFGRVAQHGPALPVVADFRHWMLDHIERHDVATLLRYQQEAPGAALNHPTVEHLMPLFVCLGAAGESTKTQIMDLGIDYGMLAMDGVVWQPMN